MTKTDIKNLEIYEDLLEQKRNCRNEYKSCEIQERMEDLEIKFNELQKKIDKMFIKLFKKGLINIKNERTI